MPYFLVAGASIYDKLQEPKFHLLGVSEGQDDNQSLKTELENQYAELVGFNAIPLAPQVAEIFGTNKSFNVLLRPDNYIGFISTETSLNGLRVYLTNSLFQA